MIADGYEVERIFHRGCDPTRARSTVPGAVGRTGYENATRMENAAIHQDVDFKGELPPCMEACYDLPDELEELLT